MWYRISKIIEQDLKNSIAICIIFRKNKDSIQVLLEKRGTPPDKHKWCLPGGHVQKNEKPIEAAIREIKEETNLILNGKKLHFLNENNINGKKVSVYCCLLEGNQIAKAGSDAEDLSWTLINKLPDLIHNNNELIKKAYQKLF